MVDRDAVINLIKYSLCDLKRDNDKQIFINTINSLPSAQSQPCEDAVSRQDVDAYIAKLMSGYLYDEERTRLEEFSAYLWELPSVTPERLKGTWKVFTDINADRRYSCSICNNYIIKLREDEREFNYCPNCGAEMSGGGEDG